MEQDIQNQQDNIKTHLDLAIAISKFLPPTNFTSRFHFALSFLEEVYPKISDPNLTGKDLAKSIITLGFLSKELAEDFEEILNLQPQRDEINDSIYAVTSFILIIFYLQQQLPLCITLSPKGNINLIYINSTVIVDGTTNLYLLDEKKNSKNNISINSAPNIFQNLFPEITNPCLYAFTSLLNHMLYGLLFSKFNRIFF